MRVHLSDGASPRLVCLMNLAALDALPVLPEARFDSIKAAGYDGVQFVDTPTADDLRRCRSLDLLTAGSARVNLPDDAREVARALAGGGLSCATLHVGWGMEDDSAAHALIEAVLEQADVLRFPLYPETHRATILQDLWRTVQFVGRYPALALNGDFSHWYTGSEMVYGGFENKLRFIAPVLSRVRFLHGRIGNPGCIQVALSEDSVPEPAYVGHFRFLWTKAMRGFQSGAVPGDVLPFAPELLSPRIYYAREFRNAEGQWVEESDRWTQALLLCRIARECFAAAGCSV